jgi:hypothetical protein
MHAEYESCIGFQRAGWNQVNQWKNKLVRFQTSLSRSCHFVLSLACRRYGRSGRMFISSNSVLSSSYGGNSIADLAAKAGVVNQV